MSSEHITLATERRWQMITQNSINHFSLGSYRSIPSHPSPFYCHSLLSLPGGGCYESRSAPISAVATGSSRQQQQQGQQMSTAIGFFPSHWPSPRPTQWGWLSMRHTLTHRGGFTQWAVCRFPRHMPHLRWNVIIFNRHGEEWGKGWKEREASQKAGGEVEWKGESVCHWACKCVCVSVCVCVCVCVWEREREREGREDATNAARQQFNTSLNLPVRATERRDRERRERRERSFHFSPQAVDFNFFTGLGTQPPPRLVLSLFWDRFTRQRWSAVSTDGTMQLWGVGFREPIDKMWVVRDHRDTETPFAIPHTHRHTHTHTRRLLRLMVNKEGSTHHKRQTLDLTAACSSGGCCKYEWQRWLCVCLCVCELWGTLSSGSCFGCRGLLIFLKAFTEPLSCRLSQDTHSNSHAHKHTPVHVEATAADFS